MKKSMGVMTCSAPGSAQPLEFLTALGSVAEIERLKLILLKVKESMAPNVLIVVLTDSTTVAPTWSLLPPKYSADGNNMLLVGGCYSNSKEHNNCMIELEQKSKIPKGVLDLPQAKYLSLGLHPF